MSDVTNKTYSMFKQSFADKLSKSKDLHIDDVQELVTPLALEQITDTKMWDHFTEIILTKEH